VTEAREANSQSQELRTRYEQLTPREREVLTLVVRGPPHKQSATMLGTGERTIKAHRAQGMFKMPAQSVADLVRMSARLGIIAA
jgi:FixJ family two-component response regulator